MLTMALFWLLKKRHSQQELSPEKIVKIVNDSKLNDKNKIKFLINIKKLEIELLPWFMKAISTIGVIVFFSMLLATLLQTVTLSNRENKLKKIEKNVIIREKEFANTINILISNIEEQLIRHKTKLTKDYESIINYKITELEKESTPNHYAIYRLAMLIGDKEKAFNAITKSDRKATKISDVVSLVEYQCYIGNKIYAKKLLEKYNLGKEVFKIKANSPKWALKIYVLMTFVEGNKNKYISHIMFLLKKKEGDSLKWLNNEIEKLENNNRSTTSRR